jgi:DNA-binding transcriptional ArsR family regulator
MFGQPLFIQAEGEFIGGRRSQIRQAILQPENKKRRCQSSAGDGGISPFQPPQRISADKKPGGHICRGDTAFATRESQIAPELAERMPGGKRERRNLRHATTVRYFRRTVKNCPIFRTIQQEVGRLKKAELLTARRDGNRLYYRANTKHPIFPELQGIALKTTGLREQIAEALVDIPGIDLAFVFGSSASGTTGAASDVDLFVVGTVGLRALAPRFVPSPRRWDGKSIPTFLAANRFRPKREAATPSSPTCLPRRRSG